MMLLVSCTRLSYQNRPEGESNERDYFVVSCVDTYSFTVGFCDLSEDVVVAGVEALTAMLLSLTPR